jgi:hypothetical protein
MTARSATPTSATDDAIARTVPAAVPQTFDALVRETAPLSAPELAQGAQRAVEHALSVAEKFTPGEQRAVNLQFSVSGVPLDVHVAMRGGAIHTTFRTDSTELRTALAHEWQSVSNQSDTRAERLAEPVFAAASPHSGPALQSDAGGAHQRETGARQEPATPFPAPRAPSSAPAVSTSTPVRVPATDPARLLHAFA